LRIQTAESADRVPRDASATLTFPVTAGREIWLSVGPTTFSGPVIEFPYFMTVSNNTFVIVPNEKMSWKPNQ